jgi:hypothetical protein
MTTLIVGAQPYHDRMTTFPPTPLTFGRSPIRKPDWRFEATDADYDDPTVIAANLQRELDAARERVAARLSGRRRTRR